MRREARGEPQSLQRLAETSRDLPIPVEEFFYTPIDDGWHHEMDDLVSWTFRKPVS